MLINKTMKNIQIIQAQEQFICNLTKHCTHTLTLQTKLKTYNAGPIKIQEQREQAIQAFRSFRPKLNRLLTGNGHIRKLHLVPIIIPAIEGTLNTYDRNRTLHYHLALGNFDTTRLDLNFVEKLIESWTATGVGTDDIKMFATITGREQGWGSYINKEYARGNDQCIDLANIQIPNYLL